MFKVYYSYFYGEDHFIEGHHIIATNGYLHPLFQELSAEVPPVGDVGETVCLLILATIMKHTLLFIKDWLHSFLSLLFPRCCIVCGRPLSKGEECLCTICNITLPRTNCHLRKDNPVERLFWEQIPLERAPLFSSTGKGVISGRFFIS